MEAARVLLVEDDARLRTTLVKGLTEHGMTVSAVSDGRAAVAAAVDGKPLDVIVLDIGLPDSDGRDVCRAMRVRGIWVPVLYLTARGDVTDILSGYAAGGDDYLAKPFHFAELVARLRALTRRADIQPSSRRLSPVHLEPGSHALAVGELRIPLTPTEYRILGSMLSAGDRIVRRRDLVSAAWPPGAIVHDNTLDQYIARIRRKLAASSHAGTIRTVHGVGYRYQ